MSLTPRHLKLHESHKNRQSSIILLRTYNCLEGRITRKDVGVRIFCLLVVMAETCLKHDELQNIFRETSKVNN